jgi:uncharacterized membrane protein
VIELLKANLDGVAVAWFVLLLVGYRLVAGSDRLEGRSIVGSVQAHRVQWMCNMAARDNRMLDAVLLGGLGHGNAFFASTSAIAIGGLIAIVGSGEKAQGFLERLPYAAQSSPVLWEIKVLLLIAIFVYAFFKFAWAFRLSHYTGIMIGSTPIMKSDNEAECAAHAQRTARLIGIAADHANSGLRSFYYAIAAMAWFFHPLLFMAASTWVLMILIRRDFFSRSNRILAGRWP